MVLFARPKSTAKKALTGHCTGTAELTFLWNVQATAVLCTYTVRDLITLNPGSSSFHHGTGSNSSTIRWAVGDQHEFNLDPFQSLDTAGVGQLIEIAVEKGRKVRNDLKIGICGEHGGDPASIDFCHKNGLNYVSCSPFRVPIARLAAAHSTLKNK